MRYYHICFRGNSEDIKNDEEIERIIHGFGSVLYRMNDFLWKNTKNNVVFFFYHEEANLLKAIFAYDEQSYSFVYIIPSSLFFYKPLVTLPQSLKIKFQFHHKLPIH